MKGLEGTGKVRCDQRCRKPITSSELTGESAATRNDESRRMASCKAAWPSDDDDGAGANDSGVVDDGWAGTDDDGNDGEDWEDEDDNEADRLISGDDGVKEMDEETIGDSEPAAAFDSESGFTPLAETDAVEACSCPLPLRAASLASLPAITASVSLSEVNWLGSLGNATPSFTIICRKNEALHSS